MRTSLLICALLVSTANAFGKKREDKQGAAGVRGDLENEDTMRVQHEANGGYGGGGAREYEMENMARHRAGELNTAELGMANMKHAMNDPSAMAEMAEIPRKTPLRGLAALGPTKYTLHSRWTRLAPAGRPDLRGCALTE